MTPAQFLTRMERGEIAPAYLFIGPEAYQRRRARRALLKAHAVTQYDLAETSLAEVIDDARALSLFASERVILAGNAEAALPRTRADEDAGDGEAAAGSADLLTTYLKDPTPGVVLVFDAPRFDFEGEDKKKQERVRKFYASAGDPVEFKRASADDARREAAALDDLQNWLQQESLTPAGGPIYGYFDPPWTPSFLRRNEVMLRLAN